MTVELTLANWSICAPPRNATSAMPRCSTPPSDSTSEPSRAARYITLASDTEMGVGITSGEIGPVSTT